ncbi:50S ribosomal protein L21 chloroplastic [Bienertia sinuspersici]
MVTIVIRSKPDRIIPQFYQQKLRLSTLYPSLKLPFELTKMASTTLTCYCSSLCSTLQFLQNQNPISKPLSQPVSRFLSTPISPPILTLQNPSLSQLYAFKKDSQIDDEEGDDSESVDLPDFKRNAFARPKLSDVLPDDIEIPKPGTPEYDDILEKLLPKKSPPPPREEIFAVVMVGSRQYIVIPGRWIYTQRLKEANVNDKIVLNKVLLVGTKTSTYIGKPVVTNAAVHAVVEEQLLDDKVIVFKYKKKKNYRRTKGHRQPITRIKITGITGFEDYPASTLEAETVSS